MSSETRIWKEDKKVSLVKPSYIMMYRLMIDKSPLYMWVIVQQRATTAVARDCSVMRLSCSRRRTCDMTAAAMSVDPSSLSVSDLCK